MDMEQIAQLMADVINQTEVLKEKIKQLEEQTGIEINAEVNDYRTRVSCFDFDHGVDDFISFLQGLEGHEQEVYENHEGRFEQHHVTMKYLGEGTRIWLDAIRKVQDDE